jgi:hypothetical protein
VIYGIIRGLTNETGRTDLTKITTIRPLLFDDNLIIAFSKQWLDMFSKIPEFEVSIDGKGRLCLVSMESAKK